MKKYIEGLQTYYTDYSEILKNKNEKNREKYIKFREDFRENEIETRLLKFDTFWQQHEDLCHGVEHLAKKENEQKEIEALYEQLDEFDRIYFAQEDVLVHSNP